MRLGEQACGKNFPDHESTSLSLTACALLGLCRVQASDPEPIRISMKRYAQILTLAGMSAAFLCAALMVLLWLLDLRSFAAIGILP